MTDPGIPVVLRAAEAVEDSQKSNAASAASVWGEYVALLRRIDDAQAGDVDRLATLMRDLGLSPERVELDMLIVREAETLQQLAGERMAARRRAHQAHEEYKAMQHRYAEEEQRLLKAMWSADSYDTKCGRAKPELDRLQSKRPELFDDSDPPRLRSE